MKTKPSQFQDEQGVWRHRFKDGRTVRCTIRICHWCGEEFADYREKTAHCSKECGARCRYRGAPYHETPKLRGFHAARWDGGRIISRGYVMVYAPDHPRATRGKYVFQHRLVMEEMLGRYLEPNEYVHHRNGDKADNRPENLEMWVGGHPSGVRASDLGAPPHCPTCTCGTH